MIELTEYLKYLMFTLLLACLLFMPFIIEFIRKNISSNDKYKEDETDKSTTLNLNNFTCGDCKGTFTDPRPLSEIPIKPVGSITVCHICYHGELRNEELSKIFPNKRPMTPINVHTEGKGIWQRQVESKRSGLSKKETKTLQKLVDEIERTKARRYTL